MRRLWGAGVAAALFLSIVLTAPLAANASSSGSIASTSASRSANAATAADEPSAIDLSVGDIRRCLAVSEPRLNIFYLVDDSGSLRGSSGTDSGVKRADILGDSLRQLSELDGVEVNWAMGFFTDSFVGAGGWETLTDDYAGELEAKILAKDQERGQGWTNWLAGIRGAQDAIASKQQEAPGCAVLVWLTDGALDVRTATSNLTPDHQARRAAFEELCGNPLGTSNPGAGGAFNELRHDGVVVFGVMLNTSDPNREVEERLRELEGAMVPLVEGEGEIAGIAQTCGQHPIPAGYAHGAYLEGTTQSLGLVFLKLGAQLAGGYPNPIGMNGEFEIVEGVSEFRLTIPSEDFTLEPPTDSGLPSIDGSTTGVEGVEVRTSSGSTVVIVDTQDPSRWDTWQLTSGRQDVTLFLTSGLRIEFSKDDSLTAGEEGEAMGTVLNAANEPANLALYDFTPVATRVKAGQSNEPVSVEFGPDPGSFTVGVPAGDDVSSVVRLRLELTDLTVAGLKLLSVEAESEIPTLIPGHFPQLHEPIGPISEVDGMAQGVLVFDGPTEADSGEVCFATDSAKVTYDSAGRGDWEWPNPEARCWPVQKGDSVEIPFTAKNEQPAQADVTAVVTVTLHSSNEGVESKAQPIEIEFETTHEVNPLRAVLLALALLLLGILLPLLALWLLNWRTTRLDIDNGIQRARFTVRIGPGGVAFADAPASDSALAERFQYRPPQHNVRSIDDPDLGRLAAHVPWFPLAEPAYRITPRSGTSIIGARTSARAASAGIRRADGSMEFRQLPLDAFWAILVSNADLARTKRGDEVSGTAVLYHRMDPSQQDQYRNRLNDIALEGSLTDAVDRSRAGLAEAQAKQNGKKSSKGGDTPSTAAAPTPGAPARDGAPPPRGGATPPPRDGAPPPRGGTTPPPRPGASGPPPLPGSPPPRPRGSPPPRGH